MSAPHVTTSYRRAGATFNKLPLPGTSEKLIAFDQNSSAGEHDVRHSSHLDAFEHGIVHAHVMGLGADSVFALWIEDHQVGVTANRDSAFARIQAEQLGGRGGNQFDEAVHAEASLRDAA